MQVYGLNGVHVLSLGSKGNSIDQFDCPSGVALDEDHVYVCLNMMANSNTRGARLETKWSIRVADRK